jgi:OmcA/MtrC family decaheme c-type cytochrome
MCHNANQSDEPDRPAAALPAETVHFKVLIHKIHRGGELENEYTVYSSRGAYKTNEGHFPGDLKDCGKCHLAQTNLVPLPAGVLATQMLRGDLRGLPNPTMPYTSTCTACHDSLSTASHCLTMTAGGTREACATCHGEGKEFAVSKMHTKIPAAVQ